MFWSYALAGGRMAVTTVLSFVLAALLGPRSFGLIAMALVFVGFVELLLQQGLLPAIVQRKELRAEHADTAFWLVMGTGLVLTAACVAVAPVWAAVNQLPELAPVIWALSLLVPLQALVVVQEALLRRALRFKSLALRGAVAIVAGGVAGLAGALLGWGVWALVAQQLVTAAVGVVVLWSVSDWRPRRRFERRAAGDLYRFSIRSAAASLGLFVGTRADVLLAGAFFGPVVVGIYRLAQRLTDTALEVSARAMQAVALPGLSQLQSDIEAFRRRWLQMQRVTASLSLPLLGFLVGAAAVLTELLGEQWSQAVVPIRLLAVAQLCTAVSLLTGPTLQALGRPGVLAVLAWVRSALLIGGLLTAGLLLTDSSTAAQLMGMLTVALATSAISATLALAVAIRVTRARVRDLARAWIPGLLSGSITAATTVAVAAGTAGLGQWPRLGLTGAAAAMCAAALLWWLEPEFRRTLTRRRKRGRPPIGVDPPPVGPWDPHPQGSTGAPARVGASRAD